MENKKQYIVRKYILAKSAQDAIKLDKTAPVDDVWVDEKWLYSQEKTETICYNKGSKKQ